MIYAKQSATYAFKTVLNRAIQKTTGAIGDLIGNKIADKITKASRASTQKSSDTVTNEVLAWQGNALRKIHISRKKRENDWWSNINIIILME